MSQSVSDKVTYWAISHPLHTVMYTITYSMVWGTFLEKNFPSSNGHFHDFGGVWTLDRVVWVTYEVKIEVKMGICLCYAGMPESVRIKVIKLALYLVVWFPSRSGPYFRAASLSCSGHLCSLDDRRKTRMRTTVVVFLQFRSKLSELITGLDWYNDNEIEVPLIGMGLPLSLSECL